jgi:hypothetical protein
LSFCLSCLCLLFPTPVLSLSCFLLPLSHSVCHPWQTGP